jgi:hypothetical protein
MSRAHGGDGGNTGNTGNNFALIVVLFIRLKQK